MKYEKAMAEVILFDNSDVITASAGGGCAGSNHDCSKAPGKPGNCSHGNTKDTNTYSACPNVSQRSARGSAGDFFSRDTGWL